MMCRVLCVSRSSYYQWKNYPIGKRRLRSDVLDKRIWDAYDQAKGRYGSPRLSKELSETALVSRKTVAKHMKSIGLRCKLSRKYKPTTDSCHKEPVAENILNRNFLSLSPALKCVSYITYIQTK